MYSTCIYCNRGLGTNEVIESFPVGRRLAFDPVKGRLWVVCRTCGRWNLTPLEERWEAVEESEKRFRSTRLRAATDNIGLAKLPDGLELVRVGAPLRPELAAWRYADVISGRRRRALAVGAWTVVAIAGMGYGLASAGFGGILGVAWHGWNWLSDRRVVCRIPTPTGVYVLRRKEVDRIQWTPPDGDAPFAVSVSRFTSGRSVDVARVSGDAATVVLARTLARLNRRTGTRGQLSGALQLLEELGNPLQSPELAERYWRRFVQRDLRRASPEELEVWKRGWCEDGRSVSVFDLPAEQRLALEMAANEEAERRALEGELSSLEEAWRDAEEIAAMRRTTCSCPSESDAFWVELEGRRITLLVRAHIEL